MKKLAALMAIAILSACTGAEFVGFGQPSEAVQSVSLRSGGVTIAAPSGFCVDTSLSKIEDGFVVLGGCDVITRGRMYGPVNNAILVVSVSQERADALAGTSRLANMLGNDGVISSRYEEGVSLVQLASGGDEFVPGGDPKHWQGVATVNGYLVLMSTYSEVGGTATRASGGDLILALAQNIRLNSPFRMLPKPPKMRPT